MNFATEVLFALYVGVCELSFRTEPIVTLLKLDEKHAF